jgi:hypothetical protein
MEGFQGLLDAGGLDMRTDCNPHVLSEQFFWVLAL